MRRAFDDFELAQIWTTDPKIEPLDKQQRQRMENEFGTTAIPLHVVLDPFTQKEVARFRYDPRMSPDDYLEFLSNALAAFRKARKGQ